MVKISDRMRDVFLLRPRSTLSIAFEVIVGPAADHLLSNINQFRERFTTEDNTYLKSIYF